MTCRETLKLSLIERQRAENRKLRRIGRALLLNWLGEETGEDTSAWVFAKIRDALGTRIGCTPPDSGKTVDIAAYYWFQSGDLSPAGWTNALRMLRIHRQGHQKQRGKQNSAWKASNTFARNLLSTVTPDCCSHVRGDAFYQLDAWRNLRYAAIRDCLGACHACGAKATDGTELHVDHILPRSLFPEVALDPRNLQVLCRSCNMAKGNRDSILWKRPEDTNGVEGDGI